MTREARLTIVLVLNLAMIGALVGVGLGAHSLGVLAAGGDYLADAVAVAISLLAIALRHRPPTARRPRGYPRATAIAAFINGGFLLVVVTLVIVEALHRLATGVGAVNGLPVLVVSAIAAATMVIGAVILKGDSGDGNDDGGDAANMRAVRLDTVADAAAAAGVAVTGAVIAVTGRLYWLDPVIALLIATVIAYHAVALLREVVATLHQPVRLP